MIPNNMKKYLVTIVLFASILNAQDPLENLDNLSKTFFEACGKGDKKEVKKVLAQVNLIIENNFITGRHGNKKNSNILLESFKKKIMTRFTSQKDKNGDTPYHYAAGKYLNPDALDSSISTIIVLLESSGANNQTKNNHRLTPHDLLTRKKVINKDDDCPLIPCILFLLPAYL
ncbi:hypothetical protein COB28_04180 [Candidatus Dependentiae bacterium]|nr:MAG: hypothetical protein COB28_04180 [Candidatus Dependentiae bacterium]